jgi:hypothetical protein
VPITPAKLVPFPCSSPYHLLVKFRLRPSHPLAAGHRSIPSHCCAPLPHAAACRCYAHRDAMAKRLSPRVPRSAPCWLLRTSISRPPPIPPPPLAPCSPTISCAPAHPFAMLHALFYRPVPRCSLPPAWSGQLHCGKACSFTSSHSSCRHAMALH